MMMTIMRPRKTEAMTIHSLHSPINFLLQELQGLSSFSWKTEGYCEAVTGFQKHFRTLAKAAGSCPLQATLHGVRFTKRQNGTSQEGGGHLGDSVG